MRFVRNRGRVLLLATAATMLLGACSAVPASSVAPSSPAGSSSAGSSPAGSSAGSSSAAAQASPAGGIAVTGAWVRNSTAMTGAVAGYFTITNSGSDADTLLSVTSPIAKTAQLHETRAVAAASMPAPASGMAGGSAMPSAGMMTMVEVDKLDIPAGGSVAFKPGGYHVMFMDLTGPLAPGSTVELTLVFAKAGPITVKAEVRTQ